MDDFPLLVNDLLGNKFKVRPGYQGTPQINIAIERGEIHGIGGLGWVRSRRSRRTDQRDKIKFIVQYSLQRSAELAVC